jgi:PucR C-terminal helix-turn-helix domain
VDTLARIPVDEQTWTAFVRALASDGSSIAETVKRIRKLASYRKLARDEIEESLQRGFSNACLLLAERRLPALDEPMPELEALGGRRARQGVAVDDILEAWHIAHEAVRASLYRNAPDGSVRELLLLEATEILGAWSTRGMRAAAAAHRRTELEVAREERLSRGQIVRRILLGDGGGPRQGDVESFGLDPTAEFYAVRVRRQAPLELATVDEWLGVAESGDRPRGLAAFVHGDTAGLVSELPASCDLPITAGVAGPVPVPHLLDAFRLASRALETADALGLRGCVTLADLGLAPAVLADDDVGRSLLERYVVPLERDDRSGAVVMQTVEEYIANGSQVDATATALGIHPNTVRYRVARFEELTDCSLRRNEDLFEAWWALRRRAMSLGRD